MSDKSRRTSIKINGQDFDGSNKLMTTDQKFNIDGVKRPSKQGGPRPAHHLKTHNPSPSNTLMRHAVKKPVKSEKVIDGVSLPLRSSLISLPTMIGRIDPKLEKRARTFRISTKITHFGSFARSADPTPASPTTETLPAAQAAMEAKPATNETPSLLDRAIASSTSHEQPKLNKKQLRGVVKKPRTVTHKTAIALVSIMGVLVLSYGIYANMPNVMVKVASVRAGFSAVMPAYRPSGFSLASVNYKPGTVKFNFSSNIDNRKFSLLEHSSNWDSATLVSSVIVPVEGTKYQELNLDGQTVYLYGNNQAAWVSDGILYQLSSYNGALSTNQLLKLATTL